MATAKQYAMRSMSVDDDTTRIIVVDCDDGP
jgi:hypothetical protein